MTRDEAIKIISERIVSRMLSRPETPELLEVLSDAEHAVDTLVALGVLKLKRVSDELVVRECWSDTRANEVPAAKDGGLTRMIYVVERTGGEVETVDATSIDVRSGVLCFLSGSKVQMAISAGLWKRVTPLQPGICSFTIAPTRTDVRRMEE